MDMIERVAAAIDAALEAAGGWDDGCSDSNVIARAAIEAMRELPEEPGPRYSAGEYSRRTQNAMVDDALSSDQPEADIAESVSGKDD